MHMYELNVTLCGSDVIFRCSFQVNINDFMKEKFNRRNGHDFQAILKLSHSSNTLILDKVSQVVIATNCHFKFY